MAHVDPATVSSLLHFIPSPRSGWCQGYPPGELKASPEAPEAVAILAGKADLLLSAPSESTALVFPAPMRDLALAMGLPGEVWWPS